MKALTLTQPWATLVAIGAKRYETRSWSTNYRGPLAIHAAHDVPSYAKDAYFEPAFHDALCPLTNGEGYNLQDLPRGRVIAIVDLVACQRVTGQYEHLTILGTDERAIGVPHLLLPDGPEEAFGDFSSGRFAWRLENVRRLPEPIPAKGALGLWEWVDKLGPCPLCRGERHFEIKAGAVDSVCDSCGRRGANDQLSPAALS